MALVVKNPPANAGDARDVAWIPGLGRSPGGGNGNPLQYSCGKSHRQRSLASYSPWGPKESDMTMHKHEAWSSNIIHTVVTFPPRFCVPNPISFWEIAQCQLLFQEFTCPCPTKIKMQTLSGVMKNNAMICTFWMLKNQQGPLKRVFQASFKRTDMSSFCWEFSSLFHSTL